MVRIVKEHNERQAEFLDVAQALFYDKGYEQTSVQEIIQTVGVAKGTFYHYFDSKAALLDALTKRLMAQTGALLRPLVDDPALNALEKFSEFFKRINNWKVENRDFLIEAMRVLYQDKNVLLRTKMEAETVRLISPLLAQILCQGVDEGIFDLTYANEIAEILIEMGQGISVSFAPLLLTGDHDAGVTEEEEIIEEEAIERVKRKLLAYERTTECLLGAPKGSICLIEPEVLQAWLA